MPTPHITPVALRDRPHFARRISWTAQADAHLAQMRKSGVSMRAMAAALRLSRHAISERAQRLGLHVPTKMADRPAVIRPSPVDPLADPARDPLPAGHPISWSLITVGTCLEGVPYSPPGGDHARRAQKGMDI